MERVEINYDISKLPKNVILQVINESDGVTVSLNNADYDFTDYAEAVTCVLAQLAVSIRLSKKYNVDDFFDEVIEIAKMRTDTIYKQLAEPETLEN